MLTQEEQATNFHTMLHIRLVAKLLHRVAAELLTRADNHDQSKLEQPEVSIFTEFTDKLANVTYGSEEYNKCKAAMKPALDHHYARNRHHPEWHKMGLMICL